MRISRVWGKIFGPLLERKWGPFVVAAVVVAALPGKGMRKEKSRGDVPADRVLFRWVALGVDWCFGHEVLRFVYFAS